MKSVAIVDYGMGNLRSVTQAVMHAASQEGVQAVWARSPQEVMDAERVVLHKPLMGVCVGMQMLLDHSEELDTPGLGLMAGTVRKFFLDGRLQDDGSRYKVPQMGWNQVWQADHGKGAHPVWAGVPDGSYFYFVHSYFADPQNPAHCAGQTDYGGRFCSALARDNIFATQFHPEKSAAQGLALYRNFLRWAP